VLAAADDLDDVDAVVEWHPDTRGTLAMPIEATTAAVRAAVAIREVNMVLIGLVNHQFAWRAWVPRGQHRCP
jgi:hypothetical protein